MSVSILIVEDDENLRVGLQDNLEQEGFSVEAAADGAAAVAKVAAGTFDVLILDIMLPDTDGYTLCKQFRAEGNNAMILMLTARGLEEDIVRGFEVGADDYLSKPYRVAELLARIRALLRRQGGAAPEDAIAFADFKLDLGRRSLTDAGGEEVQLTRTEFDLLAYFLQNRGRALTRHQILDEVWGQDVIVDGRTVDNFVSSLKKKLKWTRDSSFRIQTIRGVGYRMETTLT